MNTPSLDLSSNSFLARIDSQGQFVARDDEASTPEYRRLLEFMVLATVFRYPMVTENKLIGCFRTQFNVPDNEVRHVVRTLLNAAMDDSTDRRLLNSKAVNKTVAGGNRIDTLHLTVGDGFDFDRVVEAYQAVLPDKDVSKFIAPRIKQDQPRTR